MIMAESGQRVTVDVGTLSGFPNSSPPTPTSGVPNFTNILAVLIKSVSPHDDNLTTAITNLNHETTASSIPITRHMSSSNSETNAAAGVGSLVRIISYSELSCQIEILATGEKKSVPANMLFHPSATNHLGCSLTCPCQQESRETMVGECIKQQSPATTSDIALTPLASLQGWVVATAGGLLGTTISPDASTQADEDRTPGCSE
ncbi:hypothetical protein DL98DRAFT_616534 [Cadophora sp. DSE1049]|nr:hypothetical protein DL98DRAFT_616534 [Cadophora sp. DSE1049]